MATHNKLGINGEDIAAAYLVRCGYSVLDRNWHSGHKELDLIARKDDELVIVEVKTRSSTDYGTPEEAVDSRKIRRIVSAADAYVRLKALDLHVRFDIITIVINEGEPSVVHIEDAFFPPIWN